MGDVARGNVKADVVSVGVGVLPEVATPPVGGVLVVVCVGNVPARGNVAFGCDGAGEGAELVLAGARAAAAAELVASGGALVAAVAAGASCCGLVGCVVL